MDYFNKSVADVVKLFNSNEVIGLTSEEAGKRLEKYGFNQLDVKQKKTFLQVFLDQFKSFMIIILLIAAVISGIIGILEKEGLTDTFVILGILILNALIGALQEKKAESSLEALKKMAAPVTKVLRDGNVLEILTRELVPGDVVILETGSIIPADLRLIEAINLKIQESSLTGESVSVDKKTDIITSDNIPIGDRANMAHSSGIVTYGRGKGIVVETGMRTEVGKIANMIQQAEDTKTPMGRDLEKLGKTLGIAALIICAVIFLVGSIYGNSILSMFMIAVSLAVAAIPEGLPAVSTIVLAIGVQRMVKRNAIIRNLPSVETLGSATVICSDKTGTLTQNKMTVVEVYCNHERKKTGESVHSLQLSEEERILLNTSLLCVDAQMKVNADGHVEYFGDPTETALLNFGVLYNLKKNDVENIYPRVAEIPFDSERKRMSTVNKLNEKLLRVHVKGGVDEILSVCSKILLNGQINEITERDKELIRSVNVLMADSALRVLAMAYKDMTATLFKTETNNWETDLVFVGMVGMIDPARPEIISAVEKCNTAGIRPVMITGDHKNTALAIARQVGIYKPGDRVITGSELEKINEEEFSKDIRLYSVYARVAPEHKVRIVKAWQKHNEVVAMTGDGVNDAPALKQADIGVAMGITGTDVSKEAADMILTDDNFATIVSAVEEGRRIYDNILKVIQFLLSTNIGEIFLLLVTSVFNLGTPLLPIHILWVNLVTDSLPALALSVDPAEENIMKRKPRNPKFGFMTKGMLWRIFYQGIMIGILPLIAFISGANDGGIMLGQTMAFATLMFAELIHVRNLHSNTRSSFTVNPLSNKPLVGAIIASAGLALLILLASPLRETFNLVAMDGKNWTIVLLLSLVPLIIVEAFKALKINEKDLTEH